MLEIAAITGVVPSQLSIQDKTDLPSSGNTYKKMSTSSQAIYEYAIECLKSGKAVVIHYTQPIIKASFNDTSYFIWGIEQQKGF